MGSSSFASLLSLANPFHPGNANEVQGGVSTWREVLHLADLNRTFLLLHRNLQGQKGSVPAPIWNQLERQAALRLSVWKTIIQEVGSIECRLRQAHLRWILIKTVRQFPREIRDLDILVFDDQLEQMQDALKPLGYSQSGKLSGFKMELKTYRTTAEGRKVAVVLDIHSKVSYEGLTFLDEEELWKRHRNADLNGTVVPVPAPEDQFTTVILNSFFGDGGLRLTDVLEFGGLQATRAQLGEARTVARANGWSLAFREFVDTTQRYLRFLGVPDLLEGRAPEVETLAPLPDSFAKSVLLRALLEKAAHDLGHPHGGLVPSWGRVAMKFASRMSRGHLRRDSWNQIFKR